MINIIHKISVLLKITQITLKIIFSKAFSRSIKDFYLFFSLNVNFFTTYNDKKFLEKIKKIEGKIIKDFKNIFRLKREIDDTTIKDVRNLFRLKEKIDDTTVKDIRNILRMKTENEAIKNRIIRYMRNFLSMEKKIIINQ